MMEPIPGSSLFGVHVSAVAQKDFEEFDLTPVCLLHEWVRTPQGWRDEVLWPRCALERMQKQP